MKHISTVAALLALSLTPSLFTSPAVGQEAPPAAPAAALAPAQGSIQGLWVWKRQYVTDDAERQGLLEFASRHGFNRLLVQIPWKSGSVAAGEPVIDLQPELAKLVSEAAKRGIVVEALDGAPEMARKHNWASTLAMLDALIALNKTLPADARFAGIHWDIEPYTRPDWKTDERPAIMLEYLQFLTQAKQKLVAEAPDMLLSVDIPMWYDNKTEPGDTCVLEYNGETKNFHQHIQDITDYIGIMSYRQFAVGRNSVTYHVENELNYAEKIGKRVCPALETIELKGTPQITFFGQPAEKFLTEKKKVEETLKDRPGFGGVLVHQYPAVRTLLEGAAPTTPPSAAAGH